MKEPIKVLFDQEELKHLLEVTISATRLRLALTYNRDDEAKQCIKDLCEKTLQYENLLAERGEL